MGNGLANIVAAAIVALAILWTGGFGQKENAPAIGPVTAEDDGYADWYARAVGDIRNDIVVNCGCCGDDAKGQRRAASNSF